MMKMRIVFVLIFSALLAGCVSAPTSYSSYMPKDITPAPSPKIGVALGKVVLDYKPINAQQGELVRQALQEALLSANIFDKYSSKSANVIFRRFLIDSDKFAATFTARTIGTYELASSMGKALFTTVIRAEGESPWNESFQGAARQDYAVRRAIAENFRKLALELGELFDRRRALIEAETEQMVVPVPNAPSVKAEVKADPSPAGLMY